MDVADRSRVLVNDLMYCLHVNRTILSHNAHQEELKKPRNMNPKCLLRYGYKLYSQNDEDGIIEEIFKRIGIDGGRFIEIGVGGGNECNTAKLLVDGWKGLWVENDSGCISHICNDILPSYGSRLSLSEAKVDAENINNLISEYTSGTVDLLSIDIDYNDYWIWMAIDVIKPRVVVIEYNAAFLPPISLTVPYDPEAKWDSTNYFGASLEAFVRLGNKKGYKIVGCNYTGINAFFVRNDLVEDRFLEPATSEEHHEPPRYYFSVLSGHMARLGPFVKVE